jgi:hypothetical protein
MSLADVSERSEQSQSEQSRQREAEVPEEVHMEDFEESGDLYTTAALPQLGSTGDEQPTPDDRRQYHQQNLQSGQPQSQQQTASPTPYMANVPADQPAYATAPQIATVGGYAAPYTAAQTRKASKAPFIIIACVAALLLLACCAAVITYNMGIWGAQSVSSAAATGASTGRDKPSQSTTQSSTASSTPMGFDSKTLNGIVDGFSTTDVSVAATANTKTSSSTDANSYGSQQADKQFVAAGLYLPIYLQARAQNNSAALASASTMMQNMDNSAANDAIASLGGLDALTQWSSQQGYTQTTFARNLGDVQASAAGYENRSSATDAAHMLAAANAEGATEMMNYDLASDGVSIPTNVTVHAHRGMGIQNTYNYFITMSKGSTSISLAVMTQSQGKDRTAQLTSALLSSMAASFEMK